MTAILPDPARGTLLVADDDDEIRRSLAELLALEGWHVVEARDGDEALERLKARPRVALLDHRMPGLTGSEVYHRAREAGLGVPVILMTADHAAPRLAADAGIELYLEKPFDIGQLLTLIDRAAG